MPLIAASVSTLVVSWKEAADKKAAKIKRDEAKRKQLAESKAKQAALERGMTILERDIFLDNIQDKAEIIAMVNKGLEIADKKGYAIMIGHVWCKDLAAILTELYPNLKAQGYTFLTLEELYNQLTN